MDKRIFDDHCAEVESYLDFLTFCDSVYPSCNACNVESYLGETISFQIERQHQKVLRANAYLLIYNFVESTIHWLESEVIDAINDSRTGYIGLSKELYEVLLRQKIGKKETFQNAIGIIKEHVKDVLEDTPIYIESLDLDINGNVDLRKIKKISSKIGLRSRITEHAGVGQAFLKAKSTRNSLAHGNSTFENCGSSIVLSEIKADFLLIKEYLGKLIIEYETYIRDQQFLKTI